MTNAVGQSNLPRFDLVRRGKVRDVYETYTSSRLVVVTTDRISVFDVVLPTVIPGKGRVLTSMSNHFFKVLSETLGIQCHLLTDNRAEDLIKGVEGRYPELSGRVSVWRRVEPVLIEFIVRRHLTGSYWKEYAAGTRLIKGQQFPEGLSDGADLGKIFFTPSTKADVGHDQNITLSEYSRRVREQFAQEGDGLAEDLADLTILAGQFLYDYCRERGIVFLDSKFEWGLARVGGTSQSLLIDEVATPDSSRFVRLSDWEAGRLSPYDKQLVRTYCLQRAAEAGHPQGSDFFEKFLSDLELPQDVVAETVSRYEEIEKLLTA